MIYRLSIDKNFQKKNPLSIFSSGKQMYLMNSTRSVTLKWRCIHSINHWFSGVIRQVNTWQNKYKIEYNVFGCNWIVFEVRSVVSYFVYSFTNDTEYHFSFFFCYKTSIIHTGPLSFDSVKSLFIYHNNADLYRIMFVNWNDSA